MASLTKSSKKFGRWKGGQPRRRPLHARLWEKVVVDPQDPEGCWGWLGAKGGRYAQLWVTDRNEYVHRLLYRKYVGEISSGLVLDHVCGNYNCVNPNHLRAVTQKQNTEHRTVANRNSTTGFRGVSLHKESGLFRVQVKHERQVYSGGYFKTAEEAGAAAAKLRSKLFTHDDWAGE